MSKGSLSVLTCFHRTATPKKIERNILQSMNTTGIEKLTDMKKLRDP